MKGFWRGFFFLLLITALCGGLALPVMNAPARAAPQMQTTSDHVVISEVRLIGSDGSGDEFIEIYNPTTNNVNLSGWYISGSNSQGQSAIRYTFPNGIVLLPGQYYLIAHTGYDDPVLADAIYNQQIPHDGGVALFDADGEPVDAVGFSPDATDHFEPVHLAPLTATTDESYERLPGGIDDSCMDENNNSIDFLQISPSNPQNSMFPRRLCGVELPTATPTSTITSTPTSTGTLEPIPAVVINEVAWGGTQASANDEWIELYNPTDTDVDLTGWTLRSGDNTPNITLSGVLEAGEFLVLARLAGTFQDPLDDQVIVNSTIDLSNNGEILTLRDDAGRTVDTVNGDGGSWPAGTGTSTPASMERVSYTNQFVTYGGMVAIADDRNNNDVLGTPGATNWIDTATITTITSDLPDPSLVNQNVTVRVTVVGGRTHPRGSVRITGANLNCTIELTASSNGTGSCQVRFSTLGSKTITATYTGNSATGHPPSSDTEPHLVSTTTVSTPTRVPTLVPPPPLIGINEFVPRPGRDWNNDGVINAGDEYIELINHGVIDVNLSGYSLDDEANIGSAPFRLPSITLRPGERRVFYGSETGLLLSDGGDGVRLILPNGQLGDAYNYRVVRFPDQSFCRLPDNGGLDDWNENCYPTPGLQNSMSGSSVNPPSSGGEHPLCPIADTLPDDFVLAECLPLGGGIWNSAYWDEFGWYDERFLPESPGKWNVFVD